MNLTELNNEQIVFNIAKEINLTKLFPNYNSKIVAVRFLIHQINYYSNKEGYIINTQNHNDFFGNRRFLKPVLDILIENNIIFLHQEYVTGTRSNSYKMVKPFKIEDSIVYRVDMSKPPVFILKWIADDYHVVSSTDSKYNKQTMTPNETDAEVKALKAKVAELEAKVIQLRQNEVVYQTQIITSGVTINNLVEVIKEAKTVQPEEYTVTLDYDDIEGVLYFIEDMENVFNIVKISNHQYNIDNTQLTVIDKVITLTGKDKFDLNQTKKLIDKHLSHNIRK